MINNIGVPAILILIGALISATGAVLASIDQSKSERALRQKSDEIATLNKQISQSITGGDSFAYLGPSYVSGGAFPESLMLIHEGKFPVYDVSFRVVDLDDFEAELKKPAETANILSVGVNQTVGNLSPRSALFTGITVRERPFVRLTIQISARNGHFVQSIRIKKVGESYKTANRVSKTDEAGKDSVIYEKVDDGFPLDQNGHVNWSA
jgi:hypothetical protein